MLSKGLIDIGHLKSQQPKGGPVTLSATLSKPLRLSVLVYLTVETTEAHGTQPGLELTIAGVNPPASSPCAGMTGGYHLAVYF